MQGQDSGQAETRSYKGTIATREMGLASAQSASDLASISHKQGVKRKTVKALGTPQAQYLVLKK